MKVVNSTQKIKQNQSHRHLNSNQTMPFQVQQSFKTPNMQSQKHRNLSQANLIFISNNLENHNFEFPKTPLHSNMQHPKIDSVQKYDPLMLTQGQGGSGVGFGSSTGIQNMSPDNFTSAQVINPFQTLSSTTNFQPLESFKSDYFLIPSSVQLSPKSKHVMRIQAKHMSPAMRQKMEKELHFQSDFTQKLNEMKERYVTSFLTHGAIAQSKNLQYQNGEGIVLNHKRGNGAAWPGGIVLEYKMVSDLFNFTEIRASEQFGVKQYQNAIYRGELNQDGRREGWGVMIYDTGRLYEGQWKMDQREGMGYELFSNGNQYKGLFRDNKPNGDGVYEWLNGDHYEGQWKDGERHGKGIWKNHTGEIYDGEWTNGEAHGYGVMTWLNGDRYEGNWVNCRKHGEGKDFFFDGSSYVGSYEDGSQSGFGEYQWPDGSYYKGHFLKGQKDGKGILFKKSLIDPNKWIIYEGGFERDKRKGFGEVRWSNGSEYKGYFDQDERNGKGEMRWYDGTVYIGEWVMGKQHGWGSLRMPNGDIKTGYFVNNSFQGTDMQFGMKQNILLANFDGIERQSMLPSILNKNESIGKRAKSDMKNAKGSNTHRLCAKKSEPLWKPTGKNTMRSYENTQMMLKQKSNCDKLKMELVASNQQQPLAITNGGDYQQQQQNLVGFDPQTVSPEEVGKVIHALQEEIKIIKLQLENLPGYSKGEVPPHLHKLKSELEKIYDSLEKKNEMLMNQMMKNFGKTQQDLPNFKLPDIPNQGMKRPSLFEMQTPPQDLSGTQPKGTNILKPPGGKWAGRQAYTAKKSLGGIFKSKKWKNQGPMDGMGGVNDPPPINEDDINKGMINLLNKGIIPRDIDLTPAFEKGAPPVMCKGVRFYEKREQNVKREIQTGPTLQNQLKFDLQPLPQISKNRSLMPFQAGDSTYGGTKQFQPSIANLKFGQNNNFLALPAPEEDMRQMQTYQQYSNMSQSQIDMQKDRSYNELMDIYSLHEFIIRKGKVLDQTPEFISFKRTYIHKWGSISYIIHLLEKLLTTYNIDMAYIEGKQVAMLAEEDLKKPPNELLFDCIVNKEEVGKIIKIPSRMFKGPKGPELAAITIQKNWRMYKAHTAYSQLKFLMGKASVIQRRFRLYQFQKQTKAKVEEITNESLFVWREMMEEFKSKWSDIKKKKRVEIHINSISVGEMKRISMEKFLQRENSQISRIFAVKDPLVEVIYVTPFQMTNDVTGYYMKILEIGEIENANNKLNIIVPDNIQKFPHHFSLAQVLMYSPKTVKRIKNLIKGKQAYIIPGVTSTDDIKLSINLSIPILSGEPSKQNLYSTKSGSKKIFQLADVPTPISAIDIYDEQEFYLSLAKLISNNMYVQTWIFKIDDEFNGRGHAYLAIDNIKPLADLRRKQVEINEELVDKIISILSKHLPKKVKLAYPRLYDGWQDYVSCFCKVGGVIEAAPTCMSHQIGAPTIAFMIEPNGEVQLIGSMDRFQAREYINAGCFFPQLSLPNMNMMTISKSIGDILYEKGIIGHITVDLVSFPDPTSPTSHPLFWAVDLNCGMTDYASACFFFDFLMDGQLDQFTGKYYIENVQDSTASSANGSRMGSKYLKSSVINKDPVSQRSFMYCKYLHHPGLASIQYKTFFHMCRLESISFDLERRSGATFMLQDCLQSGVIAMMTISEERREALQLMIDAFKFLENQAGNAGVMAKQKNVMDESRTDEVDIADVISSVRLIHKATLKKEEKEKIQRANQRRKL